MHERPDSRRRRAVGVGPAGAGKSSGLARRGWWGREAAREAMRRR